MCPKGRITVEEAELEIPFVVKRIAQLAVDCAIQLDKYQICSYAVESRIMGIQGYANYLVKLAKTIWRTPQQKKQVEQEDVKVH